MDDSKLFHACKTGDLSVVKELFHDREIDFNIRDRWDSSPLYYACLCGHEEVVRFLLENGAICDANTFDGERCVFGALTNSIRDMLVRDYQVISRKVLERRDYDEFLRKTLEYGDFSDVIFNMNGTGKYKLHRCILESRCDYFRRKLSTSWRSKPIVNASNDRITTAAFKVFLRFVYTGIIEFPQEIKKDVCAILWQAGFKSQVYDIEKIQKPTKRTRKHNILLEYKINDDLRKLYNRAVEYQGDYGYDNDERGDFDRYDDGDCPTSLFANNMPDTCDIIFIVENKQFHCHRLFICGRSDYFRSLVQNHFSEARRNKNGIAIFELHTISADLFQNFLRFIYTEYTNLTYDNVFDLLLLSDQYFVPSLKRFCSAFIEENIEHFNSIELIRIARSMMLIKLEKAALEYIAKNLDDFLVDEEFKQLVIEDAQNVVARQETDSIDIIDDVRYYISVANKNLVKLGQAYQNIEDFLYSLNLEA